MPYTSEAFQKMLDSIEALPTLPVIVQQMRALLNNPQSNMNDIAILISRDTAIAGRVVRLVNSAFYGLRNRVTSIQQAIVILGLNTVKNLTMGVSVVKAFEDMSPNSSFDREQFWLHCFATAQMAKHLAKELKKPEPEDYFLAGLLHDIGILVFDQFFHLEYLASFRSILITRKSLVDTEKLHFGMDHAATSAYIINRWKLPPYLGNVINAHHDPLRLAEQNSSDKDILNLLRFADTYTHQQGLGHFIKETQSQQESIPENMIQLRKPSIEACFSKTEAEVRLLMREWGL
jgi:putative nucleotidyltransferase with HDIG domain